jgi:tetratricopeptide (TPR) repeat protein
LVFNYWANHDYKKQPIFEDILCHCKVELGYHEEGTPGTGNASMDLLVQSSCQTPIAIIIDALERCDRETLDFLDELYKFRDSGKFIILASIGNDDLAGLAPKHHPDSIVELHEFLEEHFLKLVGDTLGEAAASSELAHKIYGTFGGNAHVLVSSLRSIINALPLALLYNPAALAEMTDGIEEFLNVSFEEYFFDRYLILPQQRRLLVNLLCCFKLPPAIEILASIVPYSEGQLIRLLGCLIEEGYVLSTRDGKRYYMRHLSIKRRIYENLGVERINLHAFVASKMESKFDPDNWQLGGELARQHELCGNIHRAAELYTSSGEGAFRFEKFRDATELLRKAVQCNKDQSPDVQFSVLQKLARVFDANDSYRESVDTYETMLKLLPPGDLRRVVVHKPLGKAYLRLGENALAMSHFTQTLNYTLTHYDHFEVQQDIISLKIAEGRYDEAIRLSEEQRVLTASHPDQSLLALVETDLGIARFLKGEYQESLQCFTTAYELYRTLKNKRKMIDELNNIGNVHSAIGEHRAAIEKWEAALQMMTEVGTQQQRAEVLNNMGIAHYNLHEFKGAKTYYESAKKIFTQLNVKSGVAMTLTNLGEVSFAIGEYENALGSWSDGLSISKETHNNEVMAQSCLQLAHLYCTIGDITSAIEMIKEGAGLIKAHDFAIFEPFHQFLNGLVDLARKQYREGLEHYLQAEKGFQERQAFTGGIETRETRLHQIQLARASIYLLMQQPQRAYAVLQALMLNEKKHITPLTRAEAFYLYGLIAREYPNIPEKNALFYFHKGLEQSSQERVSEIAWKLSFATALEYQRIKEFEQAAQYYKQAKMGINYFVWRFTSEQLRKQYLSAENRENILHEISLHV